VNCILTDAAQIGAKVTIRRNYLAPSVNLGQGNSCSESEKFTGDGKGAGDEQPQLLARIAECPLSQAEQTIRRLEQDGSKMKDGAQQLAQRPCSRAKAQRRLAMQVSWANWPKLNATK
jgi:hypothetical protein